MDKSNRPFLNPKLEAIKYHKKWKALLKQKNKPKHHKRSKQKKKKAPKRTPRRTILEFLTDKKSQLKNHEKLVARFKLLKHYLVFKQNINKILKVDYSCIKLVKKHAEFGCEVILHNLLQQNQPITDVMTGY